MKKLLAIFIIWMFVVSMLAACRPSKPETGTGADQSSQGQEQGITTNKLLFEEIGDLQTLPEEIAGAVETLRKSRGYAFFEVDDGFIAVVGMGEKPTGGYSIKVKSIENIEGTTKITVEERSPGKDDIVTEALTYPQTVVKVKGAAGKGFQVVNEKGEKFEMLLLETGASSAQLISAAGTYNGQIDGTSIEVSIDGEPEALRHEGKLQEEVEKLKAGTRVSVKYYKNAQGQLVLTEIKEVRE